jgi:hypothetical protein
MEKDIIGRWYNIEHGVQMTYFRPTEVVHTDYVGVVGTIVKHNDELMTLGTVHLIFDFDNFDSIFIEENAVNSKVVYEYFNKCVKLFGQIF